MSQAEALLTLAKLNRGIGKIQYARSQANTAFNLCMEDLGDFVTYDYKSAFRMLGKVLMFANLKFDAEIALSIQNSEVGGAHQDHQTYEDSEAESVKEGDAASVAAPVASNGIDDETQTAMNESPQIHLSQNGISPEPAEGSNQNDVEAPE